MIDYIIYQKIIIYDLHIFNENNILYNMANAFKIRY